MKPHNKYNCSTCRYRINDTDCSQRGKVNPDLCACHFFGEIRKLSPVKNEPDDKKSGNDKKEV